MTEQKTTYCPWARQPEEEVYHHTEWGVPCLDDRRHFEFLILESAQAGLSWLTILRKREGYRRLFANFDPNKVAGFTQEDCERLLLDPGIVRNRRKVESAISNARIFLDLQAEFGSFSNYIWGFVDGRVQHGGWTDIKELPAITPVAEKLSRDMKKRGFKFLGPTVMYAHMQATGLVNDHLTSCFRFSEIKEMGKKLGL